MQDTIQRQILEALLIAIRPLARALLRAGIGYREFAEISKTAFVDIATKDYGLRGRPTNISRVPLANRQENLVPGAPDRRHCIGHRFVLD